MSFYPVQSSYHAQADLETHDDLDVLAEEESSDSLSTSPPSSSPVASPPPHPSLPLTSASVEEFKDSSDLPPHPPSIFSFHSPPAPHHRHRPSSSVCSLPASPLDPSNERTAHHKKSGLTRKVGERRRVSADPATLFLLHRIMKGDEFSLYLPAASQPPTYVARPVFVFYDAHNGRLGSLYWSTQRARPVKRRAFEEEEGDAPALQWDRLQLPSQCLPIHSITHVQVGRTEELSAALVTSLPASCFLALHWRGAASPLLLSHPQAAVMRQWVACLRDIFTQHEVEVRDAEAKEKGQQAGDDSPPEGRLRRKGGGGGGGELMSAFIDPSEENALSVGGVEAELLSLSEGLGDRKRSSLSVSENGAREESELMGRRKEKRDSSSQQQSMATCGSCVIA